MGSKSTRIDTKRAAVEVKRSGAQHHGLGGPQFKFQRQNLNFFSLFSFLVSDNRDPIHLGMEDANEQEKEGKRGAAPPSS